jgi:hypothetical protein
MTRGPEASRETPGGPRGGYELGAEGLVRFRLGVGVAAAGSRVRCAELGRGVLAFQ